MSRRSRKRRWKSPGTPSRTHPLDDIGNGRRLYDIFGDVVRHCPDLADRKPWLLWDGKVWAPMSEQQALYLPEVLPSYIRSEAQALGADGYVEKAYKQAERSAGHLSRMRAALDILRAQPGIEVTAAELNANPWTVTCRNVSLDLEGGEPYRPRPEDHVTVQIPVWHDPDATAPTWEEFVHEAFPDAEVVEYLQQRAGACLTGLVREDDWVLLHGAGSNGKSTFLEGLSRVLGPHARSIDADRIMGKGPGGSLEYALAELAHARIVTCRDFPTDGLADSKLLKIMTGGDPIKCRHPYGRPFEYVPQYKLFLAANHLPRVSDMSHGFWRRARVIEMPRKFPVDPGFKAQVLSEQSGTLNWMLDGLAKYLQQEVLVPPKAVTQATDTYRREEDAIAQWIEEMCELDEGVLTTTEDGYASYRDWCHENGRHPHHKGNLTKRLLETWGIDVTNPRRVPGGGRKRCYEGLRVEGMPEVPATGRRSRRA